MRYPFLFIVALFLIVTSAAQVQAADPNAGIKVVTVVSNGNSTSPKAPSDFQFTIAKSGQLPLFSFEGSTQVITIPLSVTVPTTFALNGIASPVGYLTTFSGDCNPDGTVVVGPGQVKTCTITHSFLSASENGPSIGVLKIIKRIDANGAQGQIPQPGNFSIRVSRGPGSVFATVSGSDAEINVGVASTNTIYQIEESNNPFSSYITTYGGDCGAKGLVALRPDGTATCIVTSSYLNTSEAGSSPTAVLKIIKRIDANGVPSAQPGQFEIDILRGNTPVATIAGSGIGFNVGVEPGLGPNPGTDYRVREDTNGSASFIASYSGDCESGGVVHLVRGQVKTCIVTNSYINVVETGASPTAILKIIKRVDANGVPPAQPGQFQIDILRGSSHSEIASVAGSEIGFNVGIQPGLDPNNLAHEYGVTEDTGGPANYLPTYTGDCDRSGVLQLIPNQFKTCLVTNSYLNISENSPTAVINIAKKVEANDFPGTPPQPGIFTVNLLRSGIQVASTIGSEKGTNVGFALPAQSSPFTVVEPLSSQLPNFVPVYSGDCAADGTMSVAAGHRNECLVTNTYIGGSNLNRPPVASSQSVSLSEDTPKSITLIASDPDGGAISYVLDSQPAHGTLSGNGPNLTYTPAANYNGSDSFTFHARQGELLSNTATVSLTVLAVNDPPVANPSSTQAIAETSVDIALSASDVENSHLTAQVVATPAHGTVTLSGLNATYTPDPDYLGGDSFKFSVSDGGASSNIATVTLTVKNGIVVNNISLSETNSGSVPATFTISLLAPFSGTTTVQYTTANANALAGQDYTPKIGTITFVGSQQISKTVTINVIGDSLFELNEIFLLQLSNPTNAVLKDGVAACTIVNDDPQVGINQMSPSNATVNVGERINLALTWTHPERWRLLEKIDFRILDDQGSVMWVQFHEPTNTFRLFNPASGNYGNPVTPGSPQRFESNAATMHLADSRAQGSGPTGPSVVLTYSLSFKPQAAGRQFRAEVFATDDFGNQQGFDFTGNVSVSAIGGSQPSDLYLRASGNPSSLFLNQSAPTAAAAQFKDSPSLNRNAGNPWREVGAWGTANPALAAGTLTALSDARVWLGLKNSDDQGTNFDLRVEVYKNGVMTTSGETYCISGVTRNPNDAKEAIVSFDPFSPLTFNGAGDVLTMKVLTRIGTDGAGGSCGGHSNAVGLRLYFDGTPRPSRLQATF